MPQISHDDRVRIVTLHEERHSISEIARRFNRRRATIRDLLRKYEETGSLDNRDHQRRPRKSTERQDRALVRQATISPSSSSRVLAQTWQATSGVEVSASTV